ncbi:Na+/H+ antiporter subunit E [uncultured Clostridium sp.]|uniref:Na+/H+ antiporter subunit E n=1 Tax=uncultured Clostridium sp. TaxID=59620 RepID=UPI0028E80877|nr:Na+/H+ antiporter subunit E [uncultured Clostridium sp.]
MKFWRKASLFIFWIILSESITLERVSIGIILSYLVVKFNEDLDRDLMERNGKKVSLNVKKITIFFKYLGTLILEIFKSNIHVAKIVLSPKMNISPNICTVDTKIQSNLLKTILSNSITLTPGTLTLFMDDDKLIIHCLQEENIKDLKESSFENILLKAEEIINE